MKDKAVNRGYFIHTAAPEIALKSVSGIVCYSKERGPEAKIHFSYNNDLDRNCSFKATGFVNVETYH